MNAHRCLSTCLVLCATALAAPAADGGGRVGFLVVSRDGQKTGPETAAARRLAEKRHNAAVVVIGADGTCRDEKGRKVDLQDYRVLWYHQGDDTQLSGSIFVGATLDALRGFVGGGRGLFLSGAAAAMVHPLGVEPRRPRVGGPGNDRGRAGITPAVDDHPVFAGLRRDGGRAMLTNRGYPAFADFHGTGGPAGGMLLADAFPDAGERPLVEYALKKGRIIAMGWRLPHYGNKNNPHRSNLEHITANVLAYLAEPASWRKITVAPAEKPAARKPDEPAGDPAFRLTAASAAALRRAVTDLAEAYGRRYPGGSAYLEQLDALLAEQKEAAGDAAERDRRFRALRREALLANPLIDCDRLLVVRRGEKNLGLPLNWQSNSSLKRGGFDNEIAVLSDLAGTPVIDTLHRPANGAFVGDVDLDFDAEKMLFSSIGSNKRWQIFEMSAGGGTPKELPLIREPDVDNYDACYLPDGRVLFTSTAPFTGVPCVKGSSHVSNIYRWDRSDGTIRRLTFEQDHDWCPTVLNDGRVLYLRWEYSDIPHFVSRILFRMNPDGTQQMEYYGSNSYWPNAVFYARPCPGHASRFVGIVGGHHDVPRMGELVLFDTAQGRREAEGVVQRVCGRSREVKPIIRDGLVGKSRPKFLHPWPLNDRFFIVAAKPDPKSRWGIYLADVYDNLVLIADSPDGALLEPVPPAPRPRPPAVADKVDPAAKDASFYIADIYRGGGLAGVPRGAVKQLRLLTYHFAYHGMGGQVNRVGLDGPWDVKRIVGTVPVCPDGSAYFRVPANTPLSLQPLDADGKALQLMRSWATAMPGETLSCVGCHEGQNEVVPPANTQALQQPPADIEPWYGPVRGFSFVREVQPVLDHHCVRCHDGTPRDDNRAIPDFTARPPVHPQAGSKNYNNGTAFTPSYLALRRYVRGHTIESDIHMLYPTEFHADTTRLIRLLEKGHHGVRLEPEALDRLVTWIDLNTPAHGTWHEIVGMKKVARQRDRRREMNRRYAGIDEDPEKIYPVTYEPPPKSPAKVKKEPPPGPAACDSWPFDAAAAKKMQPRGADAEMTIDIGDNAALTLVRIPAGRFVMGSAAGRRDERPRAAVAVDAFWMGAREVTNAQYARFDPAHDSRLEHGDFLQFSVRERGYPVNEPRQPVCRVDWRRATAFCRWLSKKTGRAVMLPTEAQWEWACRAGSDGPLWYGGTGVDFSKIANLADRALHGVDTFGWGLPSGAVPPWRPAAKTVDDGRRVSAPAGSFRPNPWGLHDMHGNVAEWTRSAYRPYPYRPGDGRNDPDADGKKVVRGGSWYDRPGEARSALRRACTPFHRVFDVGFRVIIAD